MERVRHCAICGYSRSRFLFEADDEFLLRKGFRKKIRYVWCQGCSVVYANPRMTGAEIETVYGRRYWENDAYVRDNGHWRLKDEFIADRLRVAVERYHFLKEQHLMKRFGRGRKDLLEIGCGAGFLLNVFQQKGWRVQGIEPTPLAQFAQRAGVPTHQTLFNASMFTNRCFDIVALMHVFEHLSDPVAFLRESRSILKRHGLLWLEVPNLLYPRPIDLSHAHLFFYTPSTLSQTLARAGYHVLHCAPYNSRNAAFQVIHAIAEPSPARARTTCRVYDSVASLRKILEKSFELDKRKKNLQSFIRPYSRVRLPAEK